MRVPSTAAAACCLLLLALTPCLAAHPPPSVCCDGSTKRVDWVQNMSGAHGAWCKQMQNSKENYMGCAALMSCERNKQRIWLTCPDGYEGSCDTGCTRLKQSADCGFEGPEDLFEWVRSKGGFVDPRLEISTGPLGRGLFAKDDIEAGELLVAIPTELIISDWLSPCAAIQQLRQELRRGRCSPFWPYLKSLKGIEADLPDAWSLDDLAPLDGLPVPEGGWRIHSQRYMTDCLEDGSDALAFRALLLYHTRAGPLGMTPVVDLMNHGYNYTWHHHDREDGLFSIRVVRDIKAGGEIFTELVSGVARKPAVASGMHFDESQGAPEVFRNYGFIEQPPVMWWFDGPASGDRHAWIAMDLAGTPRWFTETEHGPGTNLDALVAEGSELLAMLQEREQAAIESMASSTRLSFASNAGSNAASKRRTLALAYRQAFKDALESAVKAAMLKVMEKTVADIVHNKAAAKESEHRGDEL